MNHDIQNSKSLAALLSEMKEELKDFAQTRVAMMKSELLEKAKLLKSVAPLAVIGLLLLVTSYLLLTMAIVGLVAAGVADNRFRWAIAFGAVGFFWATLGAIVAYAAKRDLQLKGLMPKRTVEVLKGDKRWIQSEVRNQI